MLKKTTGWLLRFMAGTVVVLALSSALLIYKERDTLSWLVNPGLAPAATDIYSRWLEMKADDSLSWARAVGWLQATEYRGISTAPSQPGDYHAAYPDIEVFARPFRYPDKDYPAQRLVLNFSNRGLHAMEAVSGQVSLSEWRLEPVRLAEWRSVGQNARTSVKISELPPYVPRAILAMEDKRFFTHGAFDGVGIARAFWVDLRHAQLRQGASTISQQLARSIFLDVHRTWRRKALEAALAFYLELRYSKPQLLEMYLNQVYWGQEGPQSLLGLEAVSQSLFGHPARALSVAESATLAGMLQSPNRFSPRVDPKMSLARRKIVLNLMRDQKVISDSQYRSAQKEKISLAPVRGTNNASYFLSALHDELSDRYSLPVLLNQSWKVFTTLDPLLQAEAVKIVASPQPSPVGRGRSGAAGEAPQAALVAIDPKSGAMLAWVGGTNFQTNPFDHAVNAKRQPGSAFKPFVVLAALESRKLTAATLLEDKPLTLQGNLGSWSPKNYDHKYRGQVSVWESLVYSLNVPMVRLAMLVGITPIIDAAHRAGIDSVLRMDMSLALGSSEVTLMELTNAYGTIANGGERESPYRIETILDQDGRVMESHAPAAQMVFDPALTFIVTQMLEAVIDVGTGQAARKMGFSTPAAGKTGTSENFQDAWFIGYNTELVCGVWVGYDQPKSLGHSAAGIALPLWTACMKKAVLLDPPHAFEEPKGLVWRTVDPDSGLLAGSGCIHRQKMPFLAGTEPTADCPLHPGGLMGFFKKFGRPAAK